jgi:polyphosphate kinase
MQNHSFFDRDLSWLSFNERVLLEAAAEHVPIMERMKFLAIYSSNLDEFYRIRMPGLMALHRLHRKRKVNRDNQGQHPDVLHQVQSTIHEQQERFGAILTGQLLPLLEQNNICLVYNRSLPESVRQAATEYFFSTVLSFLHRVDLEPGVQFVPENNKLYLAIVQKSKAVAPVFKIINIPSDHLPRFFSIDVKGQQYIIFLDDIIKENIGKVIGGPVSGCFSFKITRDAELNLENEYEGNIRAKIKKQIEKRDFGLATRFLHEPGMPPACRRAIERTLQFTALPVSGGRYHNLKDLMNLPVKAPHLTYEKWPPVKNRGFDSSALLLEQVATKDIIIHTPFESYDPVLRFFNEAAWHPQVTEISTTMYRVASNSKIAYSLISAARNGKKVCVFIELKARFDEANNLKWSKLLKDAGVRTIYSIPELKVHAKFAIVKMEAPEKTQYLGLLATGNLNENTARLYTDHILLTAHQGMLREMSQVFLFLKSRRKDAGKSSFSFHNLLVAQFNLQQQFLNVIDTEIAQARAGKPAFIILKMNNLEERTLIAKLYEASTAGVHISLIIRGICCLVPGVPGMSERITVHRIVDRYLEHGRVFIFHNGGNIQLYLGSADWMNRNIYRRIEVCFPVYDEKIKHEILSLISIQLQDSQQAVQLDRHLSNKKIASGEAVASQQQIYTFIKERAEAETKQEHVSGN